MTLPDLIRLCERALDNNTLVTLTFPRGVNLPRGFPWCEPISHTKEEDKYALRPQRVLKWIRENRLDDR
jgi:hypothetical protein